MGSDRRQFVNQLVNIGALSGLAAMLPSDAFARVESSIRGESTATGLAPQAGGTTRTLPRPRTDLRLRFKSQTRQPGLDSLARGKRILLSIRRGLSVRRWRFLSIGLHARCRKPEYESRLRLGNIGNGDRHRSEPV
jgi:hypothetical protein